MTGQDHNRRPRVLVVRDDRGRDREWSRTAAALGCEVIGPAADGEDALSQAATHRPELLVLSHDRRGAADLAAEAWRRAGAAAIFVGGQTDRPAPDHFEPILPCSWTPPSFSESEFQLAADMALAAARMDRRRRDAEDRRQQSELRLKQTVIERARFFELSLTLMLVADFDGVIKRVNPAWSEVLGWRPEELIGVVFLDLVHPEDHASTRAEMANLARGVKTEYFENRYRTPDDSYRWLAWSAVAEPDPGLFYAVAQDVTHRKRSEEELSFQAMLLNQIQDRITATDLEGYVTYVNEATCRMFGRPPEKLIGRHVRDYGEDPGQGARQREIIEQTMDQGQWRGEVVNYDADGGEHVLETRTRLVKNDAGRPVGLIGISTEITEKKRAARALEESERLLRLLADNMLELVALHEPDGTYLYLSPSVTKLLGYQPEELLGTNPYDLFHPDDVSHIRTQSHDLALNRDTVKTMEYRIRTKNGGYIWFDTNTQPIYDDRGQMARLLTVSRDITDRKNLEAQLRQAQKMEALGTLAGGVAHDFNNLLQVIQGYTQMLLLDHQSGDPAHGSLTEIQKAGDRAAKLVQQLLAFSRKADTRLEPIDLNQEIRQAEKVLVRTIPKMIQVEFRPSDDLWPVLADGIQIEQIVLNLGANAADAMPDGGLLIVETQNVVLDADYCRDHLDAVAGRYVMLSVSDTGHGMDRRTLDRIFEPFFTTKDVGQGTGLGLASVFGIVKNHQGYITCYSELGQGTVFKIYLPAIDGALPTEEFSEGYSPGRGAETVLIIDDEAAIRDFVVQALERFGYTTLTASTGEEGLAVYDQNTGRIDLVILDLGMPGMGGRRCLIELIERAPGLPVIIASGYTANGPVKNALAAGAAGFIPKPYQLMELIGVVRRTLDRSDDG